MEAKDNEGRKSRAFFISAAGDTGKTYLLNTLLDAARSNWGREGEEDYDEPSTGLANTYTGIAATLLKLGQTCNSTVKVPCTDLNTESSSPISSGSELARVIIDTKMFASDEVSIAPMPKVVSPPAINFKVMCFNGCWLV
jgi:hypothetical protein